ncbi:hypothetical protein ACHAXT_001516 [Thalassiosira profunda]
MDSPPPPSPPLSAPSKITPDEDMSPLSLKPKTKLVRTRQQVRPAPRSGPAALPSNPSSSAVPLPKTHIHRTPSELQLADDVRRAEYDDVRMYARLVVGMQGQMQRGCQPGGAVHPLSKKSLAGVVRTKQADDAELTKLEEDGAAAAVDASERSEVHDDGDSAPWSTLAQQPPWAKDSNDSLSTRGSMKGGGEEGEHDCVFSLEL